MGIGAGSSSGENQITISMSDGFFVVTDEETGVTSQGNTKIEALQNLVEALALYHSPVHPADEEDLEPASAPWLDS